MKTNIYTLAIGQIHVSESAIEAALAAAKLRASKTASSQAKVRYAAIAASVVLAGAASAAYFGNIIKFEPPVSPSPIVPTVAATQAEQPTEAKAVHETVAATEKHIKATEKAQPTESTEAPISYSETSNTTETSVPDKQTPAPTNAPVAPTAAPTQSAADQPATEADPLPEIDSSQLCADGKLFIALAPTGLSQIDDPEAFSDDHLYYIETKFGRYYKIQPPKLDPPIPLWIDQPKSDQMVYLYNSDGEIIGQAPIWW
ncbi:MAG: hypothetical protein IJH40_04635 [Ruminococcus sp.]|uniref:hypothetical protein n=1 Tax=Ruminococcus sp. TaxID=41978 RepID=UPI002872E932|nr:hypothetical protein [Ruminococcus sp.]MBQ3284912.1 hypothetical protein [Ruminococcus sp.]